MNIAFVILHYKAVKDTMECLDSIFQNIETGHAMKAVVVDNCSPDDSFAVLQKQYGDREEIILLHNEENLGFAKGNNVGFRYAKEHLDPDLIVMINNDTVIEQKEFIDLLCEAYAKESFDIAGPDIISLKDTINQNPIPYRRPSLSDVQNRIRRFRILHFACRFNGDKVIHKINSLKKKSTEAPDFKLHGSALIFGRHYIENYDGLCNDTFMYCEEDILKYIADRDHLKMVYLPQMKIIHKEDASTDAVFQSDRRKRLFYYKWSADSLGVLARMMEEDRK